jgi:chromosome segregation ATPase
MKKVSPEDVVMRHLASRTRGITPGDHSYEFISNLKRRLEINRRLESLRQESESKEQDWGEKAKDHEEMTQLYESTIDQLESDKSNLEGAVERLSEETANLTDDLELAQMNLRNYRSFGEKEGDEEEICTNDALLAIKAFTESRGEKLSPYMRERLGNFLGRHGEELDKATAERASAHREISDAFRSYSRMNSQLKTILEKHGFSYTEKGKHYHVFKRGFNPDIYVTLSKTPSGKRIGKDFTADLTKTFLSI